MIKREKVLNEVKQKDKNTVCKKIFHAKVEQKEKQITNEDNVIEHGTKLEEEESKFIPAEENVMQHAIKAQDDLKNKLNDV